jgi:D-sedoheptulose 7-phosphate isomerase
MKQQIESSLRDASTALDALLRNAPALAAIEKAAALLIRVFEQKGRVYACGNGGSMCDAMHFAEELTGRYRRDRAALAATAISDAGHLSCVANDFGYEQVFSRYLEAHGRADDCLVALSTSGTSKNIIRAAEAACALGMSVVVLSGRHSAALEALSTVYVCTPGGAFADRVQELHIKVLHIFIELIERHFFPENYRDDAPGAASRRS